MRPASCGSRCSLWLIHSEGFTQQFPALPTGRECHSGPQRRRLIYSLPQTLTPAQKTMTEGVSRRFREAGDSSTMRPTER